MRDAAMSTEEETVEDVNETEPEETETKNNALTINIQSWATPIVGVIMLIIGLLAGYFIRPLLPSIATSEPTPVAAVPATQGVASSTETAAQATDQPANLQELMDFLLPQVKHFQGDPNAPVTILEFSDFQ